LVVIFVDDRAGSEQYAALLSKCGVPTELTRLDFGDLFFVGRGEQGAPVDVGIEVKKLSDLIASIRSERLQGHQLPGMRAAQEGSKPLYDFAYLLIEGEMNYDAQGVLLRRAGRVGNRFQPIGGNMTVGELFKRLNSMHLMAGLNWAWFQHERECVKYVESLYRTWTDKDLDQHKSHLGLYQPAPMLRKDPSMVERMAAQLPGVGWGKAQAIAKRFKTPYEMIQAPEAAWMKIPGIGKEIAQKAMQALRSAS
jgi:ERCC4-type nuclease